MKNRKIVVFIHGGNTYKKTTDFLHYLRNKQLDITDYTKKYKNWKEAFFKYLNDNKIIVINPKMPCKENSKYKIWEIWFKKHIKMFNKNTIFIGHSLGASFLIKFFSKNYIGEFPQLHLISPAVSDVESFTPPENLSKINKQFKEIIIYHSKDDIIVPFKDSEFLHKKIESKLKVFKSKGHFIKNNSPNLEKNLNFNAK